jgi:hypothetical protein
VILVFNHFPDISSPWSSLPACTQHHFKFKPSHFLHHKSATNHTLPSPSKPHQPVLSCISATTITLKPANNALPPCLTITKPPFQNHKLNQNLHHHLSSNPWPCLTQTRKTNSPWSLLPAPTAFAVFPYHHPSP